MPFNLRECFVEPLGKWIYHRGQEKLERSFFESQERDRKENENRRKRVTEIATEETENARD
jgi:hypothetical protein